MHKSLNEEKWRHHVFSNVFDRIHFKLAGNDDIHKSLNEFEIRRDPTMQGRRRFLKIGTAIERHRRSARAEGSSGEREREGVIPSLVRAVRGISPEKNFEFNMSVEAILMHFETIFACKIRLIARHFM